MRGEKIIDDKRILDGMRIEVWGNRYFSVYRNKGIVLGCGWIQGDNRIDWHHHAGLNNEEKDRIHFLSDKLYKISIKYKEESKNV